MPRHPWHPRQRGTWLTVLYASLEQGFTSKIIVFKVIDWTEYSKLVFSSTFLTFSWMLIGRPRWGNIRFNRLEIAYLTTLSALWVSSLVANKNLTKEKGYWWSSPIHFSLVMFYAIHSLWVEFFDRIHFRVVMTQQVSAVQKLLRDFGVSM